jgi:hypothetical protein
MREELSVTEFAAAFSFEDWGFLCSKPDFLAAVESRDFVQAEKLGLTHLKEATAK